LPFASFSGVANAAQRSNGVPRTGKLTRLDEIILKKQKIFLNHCSWNW
jgi:hypothetical protein